MKEIESTWYKKIFWKITSSNFHLVCSVHRFCGYDSFKIKSWSLTWCFRETYSSLIWLNFEKKKIKTVRQVKAIITFLRTVCVGSTHKEFVTCCIPLLMKKNWCVWDCEETVPTIHESSFVCLTIRKRLDVYIAWTIK